MLDFTNVRKATEKMLDLSRPYTENFWQQVFNSWFSDIHIANEFISWDRMDFSREEQEDWNKWDPHDVFFQLEFTVQRDCYGKITVTFTHTNKDADEIDLRLSAECLLNNHFTRVNEYTFVRQSVLENK